MVLTGKSQSKITSYIMKSICLISIFYKKACVSMRYDEKILVVCQKKVESTTFIDAGEVPSDRRRALTTILYG